MTAADLAPVIIGGYGRDFLKLMSHCITGYQAYTATAKLMAKLMTARIKAIGNSGAEYFLFC